MNNLCKKLNNAITGKLVFLLGIIFFISYAFMNTIFVEWFISKSNKNVYIESMIYYNSEKLYSLIKNYEQLGRDSYIKFSLGFDFIFPFICSLFFIVFIIYFFRKINLKSLATKIMCIFGIILCFLDWLENIFLIIILCNYPYKLPLLSDTVSLITLSKSLLTIIFFVIILIGIFILSIIYIKKRVTRK